VLEDRRCQAEDEEVEFSAFDARLNDAARAVKADLAS
jgi:hypothetical protein